VFDYSLYNKQLLSEERELRLPQAYLYWLAKLLGSVTQSMVPRVILRGIMNGKASLEEDVLGIMSAEQLMPGAKNAWRKAVHKLFGERIALPSENDVINSDVQQIYGYTIVGGESKSLRRFFRLLDIPSANDIFPKLTADAYSAVRFGDLDIESQQRFLTAFRLFVKYFPSRASLPIALYFPRHEMLKDWYGFAGHGEMVMKEIWLAMQTPTTAGTMADMLITLIHESRHCVTGAYDKDRRFVNMADNEILATILRLEGEKTFGNGAPIEQLGDGSALPIFVDAKTIPKTSDLVIQEIDDDVLILPVE
jgi:hypothetical protein